MLHKALQAGGTAAGAAGASDEHPAEILGLAKGQLEPGFDADFVLVDLDTPYTVEKEKLHSKSHNTPFDGAQLYGKVFATIKAGKITYQAEE